MKSNNKQEYVAVVIVRKDGSVLIQHRDNLPAIASPDTYAICGGKKEASDKSLKAAASRELFEETGYAVKTQELHLLQKDEFDTPTGRVVRNFYWTYYDESQPIKCLEGQSIEFYEIDKISALNFCDPYHKEYLEEAHTRACQRR
ncbi:TPA: hypothetical protein DIU27_02360 [Candidatus Collierbacteria bacterium]|uniref:Nudix hydrolase domain-containing protein n=1 Tax=Candidatus Collierbacteria bacterium GW2011_GWB2_44_22 TaxID=1618387 RepID=A0A0G1K6K7_9BACT|nr:MAG: hypothetical protein UW31_C0009G0061 [Candidatus Collierbacteria bacterium GW2011_GWA2_44_13]KKT49573.1 MAG: hypothetical protein UW42_C0033G0006 [Candidatus Collierbacteria bacterium GW2011_GWB1_44_197]KKT51967.1 MAG: hypothetical protein UW44_C0005G0009 [Candidatus Collierbacteria bacterium GW2011_GWB2_44_22]KKT62263.1 MAG: hypothetical protein UW56_C0009G0037 [Candidatus Collierbacteria bacterium GW2011_GWD1_44_27]KKT66609.1 MAG: hypothetical protein UW58_C0005G0005 [Candidatus Colli